MFGKVGGDGVSGRQGEIVAHVRDSSGGDVWARYRKDEVVGPGSGRIGVVYAGGTFGMTATSAGFAPSKEPLRSALEIMSNVTCGASIRVAQRVPPMDSADLDPLDWDDLVQVVSAVASDGRPVVVIHGTDTLAYTAAVLTLAVAHKTAVVVTGSQRPLVQSGADARANLELATTVAVDAGPGVRVAFGGVVLPGFGVTKVSNVADDAFVAPNATATLAGPDGDPVGISAKVAAMAGQNLVRPLGGAYIPVIDVYPGLRPLAVQAAAEGADGLILRCYGVGTAPTGRSSLVEVIADLSAQGLPVLAVSQCLHGSVDLGVYVTGRVMEEAGALSAQGLTTEAALAAMHYLWALGMTGPEIREVFAL